MDLRALRAEFQQLTASALEEKLKPALNSIISQECTRQPSTGYLYLPILEKAQNLVPELFRAFHTHQEQIYRSRQPKPVETPESWKQGVLTVRGNEFLDRRPLQGQSYLIHLGLGGYPLFAKLQSLTAKEFEDYTVEEFHQVVTADPSREDWTEQWTRDHDLRWR
ncbi:hypothetical protein FAGAP_1892 [Fusarium agapanthi]|uniref:Uncharacterized protein n=1 Tax=Fusarium agapanthi TaxID=1803897 RepID=A0A9P5BIP1_9HYPO|nr:hypothetical protein FAGAP_1892 [Fusarium agapanthi]